MLKIILLSFFFILTSGLVIGQTTTETPATETTEDFKNVLSVVEVEASFPGGLDAWRAYLQKNLKVNIPIKRKAPAGVYTVVVKFVVSKEGIISDVVSETNHGYGMEQEVIRVIKAGPKWTPAKQNKRFVNAFRRQPITFVISDK